MGILLWLVLGGVAGWLATLIYGNAGRFGIIGNIIVGIIGAFLGSWIFNLFSEPGVSGFNLWSLLVAVVGAVILLWLVNLARTGIR